MTLTPSGSPLLAPATADQHDETQFPKGQCRYILMTPGLKGYRCACVSFHHNSERPGASCDCGHLSCFHISSPDEVSPAKNRDDIALLQQRLQLLEEQTGVGDNNHAGFTTIFSRVTQLEETVERSREEVQTEIKGSYRNISGAWQLVEQMQKRIASLEELNRVHSNQLERAGKELQDLRNRQLELVDSDESLEERIERLETVEELTAIAPPLADLSATAPTIATEAVALIQPRLSPTPSAQAQDGAGREQGGQFRADAQYDQVKTEPSSSSSSSLRSSRLSPLPSPVAWTVHVSLLPSRSQPSPFEKDSAAYKRCLSRGLHRMVAVGGSDAQSFVAAVSRAFSDILRGKPWEALQTQVRDAGPLPGLSTLRPLEAGWSAANYDAAFLREHCALCDKRGRIDSIYVAPRGEALTWEYLRSMPVYVDGLESSWDFEDSLDDPETSPSWPTRPPTTAMLPPTPDVASEPRSPLKRAASELSLATGFSMNSEREGSRSKMPRICPTDMLEIRRGVGTAL